MKCEICKSRIQETFLSKPIGAYVKDAKGKKHLVCSGCQKRFGSKSSVLENL